MMKELIECRPGEVVRLWARFVCPNVLDAGNVVAVVEVPNSGDGPDPLWALSISPGVLVESLTNEEPWPGEVARAFLCAAEDELAEIRHRQAVEIARNGEDEDGEDEEKILNLLRQTFERAETA
jgi:hypothetical protein